MQDASQPIDRKIRCPRDGVVMHKFRLGADGGEGGELGDTGSDGGVAGVRDGDHDGGVVVDRCHVCRGFWVDLGELEVVLNQSACVAKLGECHPPPELGDETLECPRCSTQLVRISHHRQRHLKLDTCSVCGGIFFDAQELTDLSAFTLLERIRLFFD